MAKAFINLAGFIGLVGMLATGRWALGHDLAFTIFAILCVPTMYLTFKEAISFVRVLGRHRKEKS